MTSLPLLRAAKAQAWNRLDAENHADTLDRPLIATLTATYQKASRDLELAESAVRIEFSGLLDAVGSARWDAENADEWVKAGAFREVEELVKGALS